MTVTRELEETLEETLETTTDDRRSTAARGLRALGLPLPCFPYRAGRCIIRLLLVLFGPLLRLEGSERLRQLPEPVIFALNHNNSLEVLLVPALLLAHRRGRPIRFAVDWMFLHLPLVGRVLRQCDPVPVYTKPARWRLFEGYRRARRGRSPVAALAAALAAGDSVGLFPEGTRNRHPHRLLRGRPGLGHLVLASGAPVVPVGIHYPAQGRLGRAPRIGRTRVRVGEALDFTAELTAVADGTVTRRAAARRVVDRVMDELAVLCGKGPPPATAPTARSRPRPPSPSPSPSQSQPKTLEAT